jgi:hypothetical protein
MTLPIDAAPVADLDHEDHQHVVLDDETHTIPPHAEGVEREIVVPLQFLEVQVILGLFPDDLVKRATPACPDIDDALLDLLQRLFGERFRVRHIPEAVQRLVVGLRVSPAAQPITYNIDEVGGGHERRWIAWQNNREEATSRPQAVV